jgi:hypothetical protein
MGNTSFKSGEMATCSKKQHGRRRGFRHHTRRFKRSGGGSKLNPSYQSATPGASASPGAKASPTTKKKRKTEPSLLKRLLTYNATVKYGRPPKKASQKKINRNFVVTEEPASQHRRKSF